MSTSFSTHYYPTVAEANYGFEMAVSREPDFDLPAFLDAESFDELDLEFPQSPMTSQMHLEDLKVLEREAAADPSMMHASDPSRRPYFRLLNAGGPPDQLLPPASIRDECLWSSQQTSSSSSPGHSATNIRRELSFPWSVRDDGPRNVGLPQFSVTGAFPQGPRIASTNAQADLERGRTRTQRKELAAIRIRTCKRCGEYVWGSGERRRLHYKLHCPVLSKENIDPN